MNHKKLTRIVQLIVGSGVCPETPKYMWPRIIYSMAKRDMIFYKEKKRRVTAVAGAYLIPEWDEIYTSIVPNRHTGEILYVPFLASVKDSIIDPLSLLKRFIKRYKVKEVIWYRRNSNTDIRRYKLRREENEQEKKPVVA